MQLIELFVYLRYRNILTITNLKTLQDDKFKNNIRNFKNEVNAAFTANVEGRQFIADSCKKLYSTIEEKLYNKYGQDAIADAYKDLCQGNFAAPFMCEQKKAKFELYANIFNNHL